VLSAKFEKALKKQGFASIAGVDEVGCGPLAGPIIAAAVILPHGKTIRGLNDSKLLLPREREELFVKIKKVALAIGVGKVGHRRIDKINIRQANLLAMKIAVDRLKVKPDYLLLDGARYHIDSRIPQKGISGGDRRCASIAAASVIAKVTRDRIMRVYHDKYPIYGFDRHKGYGTREHLAKIYQHGPCAIHRRSFFPLNDLTFTGAA
jgi:ribonuclease HII